MVLFDEPVEFFLLIGLCTWVQNTRHFSPKWNGNAKWIITFTTYSLDWTADASVPEVVRCRFDEINSALTGYSELARFRRKFKWWWSFQWIKSTLISITDVFVLLFEAKGADLTWMWLKILLTMLGLTLKMDQIAIRNVVPAVLFSWFCEVAKHPVGEWAAP